VEEKIMRTFGFAVMLIVFILIFGFANFYIGLRGWQGVGSRISFLNNKVYWILFWLIALSFILARFVERFVPATVGDFLNLIGGYWMAAMLYALIILPIVDIISLARRKAAFIPRGIAESDVIKAYSGILVFALLIGILVYGTWNARNIKVSQYNIDMDKKAGSLKQLKIAMMSDLHLGTVVNNSRLSKMVDKINELKPDIVLIAGDIIDDNIKPFLKQNMNETFKGLKSKYGVYAVTGNHDYYGGDSEELIKTLEESGIKILTDEYIKIEDSFYVAGREDLAVESHYKRNRKPLEEILRGTDKNLPIILMDHNPKDLNAPMANGVDLQVSGHTHRGQMFPSRYITQSLYELDWGYLKKDNLNIVVSSGIGTWGPPIRIGNSSELVEINLKFKE
jgi:predicted MPP superfamily phosphohydrolase